MKQVAILGATGSIGASTIDLIKREPSRYRVEALSANTNATALAALASASRRTLPSSPKARSSRHCATRSRSRADDASRQRP
jgi:1-deoxy-D-xylulose 5-phosphate reductoisomerase